MERIRADLGIVTYLLFLVAVTGLLGWLCYRLMLPTIVANPGLAAYKPPVHAATPLHIAPSPAREMERLAMEVAEEENIKQGLAPLLALAAGEPTTISPNKPQLKEAQARPKQSKQKRIALKRPHVAPDPWQTWGFAQRSYGNAFWLQ